MAMDLLFSSEEQKFCSDVINPREFLAKSSEARNLLEHITKVNLDPDRKASVNQFAEMAGIPQDVGSNIFAHCERELDQLKCPDLSFNFDVDAGCDEAVVPRHPSKILEHLQNERERRLNPQNKSIALRAMRYDIVDPRSITHKGFHKCATLEQWTGILNGDIKFERPHIIEDEQQVEGQVAQMDAQDFVNPLFATPPPEALKSAHLPWNQDEILVSVSIYLGYSRALNYHEIRLGRLMKVSDRIVIRGSQTLQDLKASFHCTQDYMCLEDVSHRNPQVEDLTLNRFPSSFFFIHDTFYIDDKRQQAVDTSQCIRQWANGRANIGEMHLGSMDTKIGDLRFRLGQPYLYQHQGVCEHIIIFTDFHLRDFNDPVGPYPLRLLDRQFRRISCIGCKTEGADWAVMDADCLPTTPAYLCRNCYKELLFFEDGTKKCKFRAVPYFDRKAMDDYGVFLEELQKNVHPVKKEEPNHDNDGFGVMPQHYIQNYPQYDLDDDMSDYNGSSFSNGSRGSRSSRHW